MAEFLLAVIPPIGIALWTTIAVGSTIEEWHAMGRPRLEDL